MTYLKTFLGVKLVKFCSIGKLNWPQHNMCGALSLKEFFRNSAEIKDGYKF